MVPQYKEVEILSPSVLRHTKEGSKDMRPRVTQHLRKPADIFQFNVLSQRSRPFSLLSVPVVMCVCLRTGGGYLWQYIVCVCYVLSTIT